MSRTDAVSRARTRPGFLGYLTGAALLVAAIGLNIVTFMLPAGRVIFEHYATTTSPGLLQVFGGRTGVVSYEVGGATHHLYAPVDPALAGTTIPVQVRSFPYVPEAAVVAGSSSGDGVIVGLTVAVSVLLVGSGWLRHRQRARRSRSGGTSADSAAGSHGRSARRTPRLFVAGGLLLIGVAFGLVFVPPMARAIQTLSDYGSLDSATSGKVVSRSCSGRGNTHRETIDFNVAGQTYSTELRSCRHQVGALVPVRYQAANPQVATASTDRETITNLAESVTVVPGIVLVFSQLVGLSLLFAPLGNLRRGFLR